MGRKGTAADPRQGLDLTGAGTSWTQTHTTTRVEAPGALVWRLPVLPDLVLCGPKSPSTDRSPSALSRLGFVVVSLDF